MGAGKRWRRTKGFQRMRELRLGMACGSPWIGRKKKRMEDFVNSCVIGHTDGVEERFMMEMEKGYASYKEGFGHETFGHELAACAVQIYCPVEFSDLTAISTILDASNFASSVAIEDSLDISLGKQLAGDVAFSLHLKNLVVTLDSLLLGNQSIGKEPKCFVKNEGSNKVSDLATIDTISDGSNFAFSVHVKDAYGTSLDQSPRDTIAAQVPNRFRIGQRLKNKNQMDHAMTVDVPESKVVQLEENKGCLDYSCTILDAVF